MDERTKVTVKKIIAVISVLTVLAILLLITYFSVVELKKIGNVENFKEYIDSFGPRGFLCSFSLSQGKGALLTSGRAPSPSTPPIPPLPLLETETDPLPS